MIEKLTAVRPFILGIIGSFAPCFALAVNMPTGIFTEEIDPAGLGSGQIEVQETVKSQAPHWIVQVGAYADTGMAQARLARISVLAPIEAAHVSSTVSPFETSDGHQLYRARFSTTSERDARILCAALHTAGEVCFVAMDGIAGTTEATAMPALRTSQDVGVSSGVSASEKTRLLAASRMVSNDDLADMRGGFFTAAGAQFDFGASIRTMVNGQLALQTNLQWTPTGVATQQLAGLGSSIQAQVAGDLAKAGIAVPSGLSQNTESAAPATQTAAGNAPASTSATPMAMAANTVQSGASPSSNAPSTASSGPSPTTISADTKVLTGVEIPGANGGSTRVYANLNAGQIQNVILNSASDQNITQNTNITLTIYNFEAWQQQLAQHSLSAQLANEMLAASGLNGGH
ncbi:MAG TPA: SPOR domain-containing protein [Rhizomicrobium sp.]|jgi:hypothetical protein